MSFSPNPSAPSFFPVFLLLLVSAHRLLNSDGELLAYSVGDSQRAKLIAAIVANVWTSFDTPTEGLHVVMIDNQVGVVVYHSGVSVLVFLFRFIFVLPLLVVISARRCLLPLLGCSSWRSCWSLCGR
jgi:hypothetical protein